MLLVVAEGALRSPASIKSKSLRRNFGVSLALAPICDVFATARRKTQNTHTDCTQRFITSSYTNSCPSSVSRINLLSSFEKEIRGSLSNSDGSSGKLRDGPSFSGPGEAIANRRYCVVDRSNYQGNGQRCGGKDLECARRETRAWSSSGRRTHITWARLPSIAAFAHSMLTACASTCNLLLQAFVVIVRKK